MYDDHDREFILNGIANGFDIIDRDAEPSSVELPNHKSVSLGSCYYNQVHMQVLKEIQNGNYVISNSKATIISPLGAVPKEENLSSNIAGN